jgi:hypothetical protein
MKLGESNRQIPYLEGGSEVARLLSHDSMR